MVPRLRSVIAITAFAAGNGFAQVDTLGIIYSIETDQGVYSYSDTIQWSARLINNTTDTISFMGGGGRLLLWYFVDSSGKLWDGGPQFSPGWWRYQVPPGDALEDYWTNPVTTVTSPFPPGLYYGLLKPPYPNDDLPFDSVSVRIVNSPLGIEISASTDKSQYQVREPIEVYVSIHNPTQYTMALNWPDDCQFNYWIDSFRGLIDCSPNPTGINLAPASTYTWQSTHTRQDRFVSAGVHSVVGELVNYALSDTVFVSVSYLGLIQPGTIPANYLLRTIYPNPFNPTTTIEFSVPRSGIVTLKVFDLLGREVETILNRQMNPGRHKVQWNASNVPSSIYFVRMQAGDPSQRSGQGFTQTRKVTVLR